MTLTSQYSQDKKKIFQIAKSINWDIKMNLLHFDPLKYKTISYMQFMTRWRKLKEYWFLI